MMFAANPFPTSVAGAPLDGNGLNYQLRNFYMIIHPPSLYIGFTSAAVPFAFAIAALATGRLDSEWIVATRKWMLFSWLFLSIGNVLGMLWAYEELGWGGPWAWDPVENAAFLPWLTASAYVHSTMIQERRGMLKVWNVVAHLRDVLAHHLRHVPHAVGPHRERPLVRRSRGIGIFFVGFMAVIAADVHRAHRLPPAAAAQRGAVRVDAVARGRVPLQQLGLPQHHGLHRGRDGVARASASGCSTRSRRSGRRSTTRGCPPVALVVFLLMGVAPLLGWRKTSPELFRKSFRWPVLVTVVTAALHLAFGKRVGFAAVRRRGPDLPRPARRRAREARVDLPVLHGGPRRVQHRRGRAGVRRAASRRGRSAGNEPLFASFYNLIARSRRRYGGYIVHVGIAVMFLGFAGRAWGVDKEISLHPGESVQIEEYRLTYAGPRMEVDSEKRMVFADLDVERHGAADRPDQPGEVHLQGDPRRRRRPRSRGTSPLRTTST